MPKTQQITVALGAVAVLVVSSLAFAAGQGILFPDWSTPTKGSYEAPAAEIGTKVTAQQPWSITTATGAVEGKTLEGKPVTVVGEVVDLSCYLQVGKHGDKHRDCGQKCAKAGQPIGLLEKDGTIHMLIPEEHDPRRDGFTTLREKLIEEMANVIKVNATASTVEGQRALYVQGFVKQP